MGNDSGKNLCDDLPQPANFTGSPTTGINESVLGILEPRYFDSINYVVGKRLLLEKLQSGNTNEIAMFLTEILTSRPEFLQEKYGKDNPDFLLSLQQKFKSHCDYYKRVIDEIEATAKKDGIFEVTDNPAWFSLKTRNHSIEQNGLNLKLYVTIPIQGYNFISAMYQLGKMLNELSRESGDKISLKVPRSFLGFLSHSDSIVIHFKDPNNKEKIERILEEWKTRNGINEENRNLGRTKFAGDSKDNSFSSLVGDTIEKWVLENYGKYDNELLAGLAMEYLIKQSQVPPKFS